MIRKLGLICLTCAAAASAQSLSVGVLGGAPFTDVVRNGNFVNNLQSTATGSNYTIGPSLRVNLPLNLRLEVDALFRPYDLTLGVSSSNSVDVSAQQWRFPVLLQYRFNGPVIHPFVEAGLSFDHLAGISSAVKAAITSGPGQLLHQNDAGLVIGGGVDVKVPFVRLSGELRYTRQTVSDFASISNLNQAEVLFGVHF